MIIRRYILLISMMLLFGGSTLFAQTQIGVRLGAGGGSIRMIPSEETAMNLATPLAGVTYRYYGGDKFLGGIELDLNLQQKSFKTLPRLDSDSSYVREITQVELPFMWQPHVELFKKRAVLFLNAGPYVAYNISSTERFVSKSQGTIYDRKYEFNSERDNRLEYGLTFGGGFGVVLANRLDVRVEARYSYGFSDILKNSTKYEGNPTSSPIDFLSISLGVSYIIFK